MTEVNKIATNQGIMTKEKKNGNRASIISRVIFNFVKNHVIFFPRH